MQVESIRSTSHHKKTGEKFATVLIRFSDGKIESLVGPAFLRGSLIENNNNDVEHDDINIDNNDEDEDKDDDDDDEKRRKKAKLSYFLWNHSATHDTFFHHLLEMLINDGSPVFVYCGG